MRQDAPTLTAGMTQRQANGLSSMSAPSVAAWWIPILFVVQHNSGIAAESSDAMRYDTGVTVAQYWSFFEQWAANSQYGYPLSWHKTQLEAEQAATAYYSVHPECTAVFTVA